MEGEQLAAEPGQSAEPLKIAPIPDGYRTASDGKYNVVSNVENDQKGLNEAIGKDKPKDEVKVAAGKKGGEASAEKRKAEAKDKPPAQDGNGEAGPTAAKGADDDAGGGEDREGTEKPLGKPDRDPRARVAEATREAREAREEARRAREEASRAAWERDQYRRQVEESRDPKRAPEAPKRDTSARPKLEDFEDYDQYTEALTEHKVNERFRAIEEQHVQRTQVESWAQGAQDSMSKMEQVMNAADETDEGWRERVDDRLWDAFKPTWMLDAREPVRPQNVIFDEMYGSEALPALMLYFSDENGQKDFSRIARLRSPREISREMAKLEERLRPATAGTRPESSVSKAPLPFQPVKGAPHTGERVPGPDASYEDHKAYYSALDRKRASR